MGIITPSIAKVPLHLFTLRHLERSAPSKTPSQAAGVILCSKTDDNGLEQRVSFRLLEAAAYGLPTLGTAVRGIPEALGTGMVINYNALTFKPSKDISRHQILARTIGAGIKATTAAHYLPMP